MFVLFYVFFAIAIGGIFLFNYYWYREHYGKYPTYDDYQMQHPELVKPGFLRCHKCSGSSIHVRGLRGAADSKKLHSCRTCGTTLYKSAH